MINKEGGSGIKKYNCMKRRRKNMEKYLIGKETTNIKSKKG